MEDGAEGWHDDLLVLVGMEMGGYHESHYLAFDVNGTIESEKQDTRQYIEWVKMMIYGLWSSQVRVIRLSWQAPTFRS